MRNWQLWIKVEPYWNVKHLASSVKILSSARLSCHMSHLKDFLAVLIYWSSMSSIFFSSVLLISLNNLLSIVFSSSAVIKYTGLSISYAQRIQLVMPFVLWYELSNIWLFLRFFICFLTVRKIRLSNCLRKLFLSYIIERKTKGGITIGYKRRKLSLFTV